MTTKLCFFDIEASNLNANFGYMLSFGWKFQGEKSAKVISIADFPLFERDPTNDKQLVKAAAEILNGADIICGHYIVGFDVPYIQTRLMYHGLRPMAPVAYIDTWRICKYKLKLNSNRLDTISKFLNVKYEKTAIDFRHWIKAMAGNKSSLRYIVQHNRYDVLVLEEVYNRIRVLCPTHPNMNILSAHEKACPTCGVDNNLKKRGFNIAKTTKSQRYQCTSCGAWSRGRPERIETLEVR